MEIALGLKNEIKCLRYNGLSHLYVNLKNIYSLDYLK